MLLDRVCCGAQCARSFTLVVQAVRTGVREQHVPIYRQTLRACLENTSAHQPLETDCIDHSTIPSKEQSESQLRKHEVRGLGRRVQLGAPVHGGSRSELCICQSVANGDVGCASNNRADLRGARPPRGSGWTRGGVARAPPLQRVPGAPCFGTDKCRCIWAAIVTCALRRVALQAGEGGLFGAAGAAPEATAGRKVRQVRPRSRDQAARIHRGVCVAARTSVQPQRSSDPCLPPQALIARVDPLSRCVPARSPAR